MSKISDTYDEGYLAGAIAELRKMPPDLARTLSTDMRGKLRREMQNAVAARDAAKMRLKPLEAQIDGLEKAARWFDETSTFSMSRPQGSAWHRVLTARSADFIAAPDGFSIGELVSDECRVFLMEHDWSVALGAIEDASEWRLPYPRCVFEFSISGRRVCCAMQQDDGLPARSVTLMEFGDVWIMALSTSGLTAIVDRNVRAACVALDADVAETEITRAPHALNKARARKHLPPLSDFHTLSIVRRSRAARLARDTGDRRGVRLHFRRGHWRHYEAHKTWIKWMLVGDPDLGFINKHYAL